MADYDADKQKELDQALEFYAASVPWDEAPPPNDERGGE